MTESQRPLLHPTSPHRNRLGDIDVCYLTVMARTIERYKQSPKPLFEQFQISEALLSTPDARISIPRFMRLGQAAAMQTGSPTLGLDMGAQTRISDLGLAGLAAMSAPTLGDALSTLIRYTMLTSRNSRGHPSYVAGNQVVRAEFYSIRPYNDFNYFVVDSILAGWTQFLRELGGSSDLLKEVLIEYPERGQRERFETYFNCPVHFGASANALILSSRKLQEATTKAQPALHRKLLDLCDAQQQRLEGGWTLADHVKEQLAPRLRGEPPSLQQVAEAMGMASWTLRRRLAEQSVTFRKLLDQTRSELALDYVRDTDLSFAEIAWLLGFSGPAAFHRAFRRWRAVNPGDFRQSSRSNAQH